MLKGSMVAVITPIKHQQVDYDQLEKVIEFHISNGTDVLVPCGTTGESATLSHEEHKKVVQFTVEKVNGRIPVIAGSGSNSTKEAVELAQFAKDSGADAHLSITPYYNKPGQEGLYQHFKTISESVALPMIMYNVPGRTGINMLAETTAKLSQLDHIAGVKEATGNVRQATEILENAQSGFILLSGEDFINLPLLSVGAQGAISVTANIAPKMMKQMFTAFFNGNLDEAKQIHYQLMPLHRAMFIESNPMPVKYAAKLTGIIDHLEYRAPLHEITPEHQKTVKQVLSSLNLI